MKERISSVLKQIVGDGRECKKVQPNYLERRTDWMAEMCTMMNLIIDPLGQYNCSN
jgi:hypothetical protein